MNTNTRTRSRSCLFAVVLFAGAGTFAVGLGGCGGKSQPIAGPGDQRGGGSAADSPTTPAAAEPPRDPREVHLSELRQLTFGGENAEAYWSFDGTELIMQTTRPPYTCDQIMKTPALAAGEPTLVSTGKGRTTCAYFFPGDQRVLYASTHEGSPDCPPVPDRSHGYVWPLYDSYEIYSARPDGSELAKLTNSPGYDAEATVCGQDGAIVFTSTRDGDIELYKMNADGSNVVRLTNTPGYDGGAFFSADCKQIVWRASRPKDDAELADYRGLLAKGLVRPSKLELYVMNADGSEARQITYLGAATFAPFFYPSGKRIIFSSNVGDPKGREFDIWAINTDGTQLEQITFSGGFDGFPMFSPDGRYLAFASNRNQKALGDTNVFVARWVDAPPPVTDAGADRVMRDVGWLADDARAGRGVGSPGLAAARDYLAERLQALGLTPVADGGFLVPFQVQTGVTAAPSTAVSIDGVTLGADAFTPLGFSQSAVVAADVIEVGHGVTAPELGVDDYKGKNAKGKIVAVRRFVPEGGKFEDDTVQRRYGDLRYKAWNAREHGAVGLIVVDVPVAAAGQAAAKEPPAEAPLPKLAVDSSGDAGIVVVTVSRAAGAALFTKNGKHKAKLEVVLERKYETSHNVVAKIPAGAAQKRAGVVVVGAHYDHLGLGGPGSLAPDAHEPHNGADDNASGSAALVEVARELMTKRAELERDVWIVAFSAEESGVLGSSALVKALPGGVTVKDVVAMLNMDMVGRLRENRLAILGGESAEEWKALLAPLCARRALGCSLGGDGYGPSDHMPFFAAGVPVLHFFTGAHAQYHKPADDTALINGAGLAQVALLVADTALTVAARADRLTLKAAPPQAPLGDVRSFGASLGTVPDYAGPPAGRSGVLLAGVRAGSPAEQAGLRRGDILVKIGKHDIRSIEDFMFVLRRSKPGEKTKIVVERDGQPLTLDVTFGSSKR